MESKENKMLDLFFDYPSKHWHFEDILKSAKIARSKANRWLDQFCREGIIKRIKERYKMPYYISNYESPMYQNKKRIFGLQKLYESGLLNHLSSLGRAKAIILFGSFSSWDWYKDSDIDIFIYGDPEGLKIAQYEMKLHHDIQLFICKDNKDINKLGAGLIKNIIKGDIIKGDINFVEVKAHA